MYKEGASSLFELLRNSMRLLSLMWQSNARLVVMRVLLVLGLAALPFVQVYLLAWVLDSLVPLAGKVTPPQSFQDLLHNGPLGSWRSSANILLLIFGSFAVRGLLPFLQGYQNYLKGLSSQFLSSHVDFKVAERRGYLDMAIHEDRSLKALFTRIRESGSMRVSHFEDRQFSLLQNAIGIGLAVFIVSMHNWILLLVILLAALPGLISEILYGRAVWSLQSKQAPDQRRFWSLRSQFESVTSLTELKLFQNVLHFVGLLRNVSQKLRDEDTENERFHLRRRMKFLAVSQFVINCSMLWFAIAVLYGRLPVGQLVFMITSIEAFRSALSDFFSNLGAQTQDSMFVSDVFQVLELEPVITNPANGIVLRQDVAPEIVFDNVSLRYPGSDYDVIKDFSLTIKSGERIAIVGTNGAGKTSLVKLLYRAYDPTKGSVRIGGHDLREIDLPSLYSLLGILSQDFNNYYMPVKESIALGRTTRPLDMERVREAAQESEAAQFIEQFEKGYDQTIGPATSDAKKLSNGEWQRLALARTLYRQARVLVLDEPTATVDAAAEARIFERLREDENDHTEILISHRFSTVKNSDRIIVLEAGTIKEMGTHAELLAKQGSYAKLFELQTQA